jgi:two-component sensor histidine kinase
MNKRWNQSVVFRITLLTFLLMLLISIFFIIAEGYISYRREVVRLTAQIDQIEQSHVPSIVSSLWLTDYELLNQQLTAIEHFPYIEKVVVETDEGDVFQTEKSVRFRVPDRTRVLTYTRRNTKFELGKLELYVDKTRIRESALGSEIISAIAHLVLALFTAATVALLFHRQVGRHIAHIAACSHSSIESETEEPVRLNRKTFHDDELHRLVEAINTMRSSLVSRVQEREIFMREIHHRIKNDMAFVSALLSLQADRSSSSEVQKNLQEAGQRILVMSEIYKGVYSGSSLKEVDLSSVVGEVVKSLRAKGLFPAGTVRTDTEKTIVPVRISVAFGTVANELLTNAAKYSIAAGTGNHVKLTLRPADQPYVAELTVNDNGKGFPEEVLNGERSGFGLTIVRALVKQHKGMISMRNTAGATVVVRI